MINFSRLSVAVPSQVLVDFMTDRSSAMLPSREPSQKKRSGTVHWNFSRFQMNHMTEFCREGSVGSSRLIGHRNHFCFAGSDVIPRHQGILKRENTKSAEAWPAQCVSVRIQAASACSAFGTGNANPGEAFTGFVCLP